KDGTPIPVEVSATILPDGRWQAFVHDISERRRVQSEREQLLEAEHRHRRRLEALRESALAISGLTSAPQLLRSIVEQARALTGADYAAISLGTRPRIFSGITPKEAEGIGFPSAGMKAPLSVPIWNHAGTLGHLSLAKRDGAAPFTAEDRAAVELLA